MMDRVYDKVVTTYNELKEYSTLLVKDIKKQRKDFLESKSNSKETVQELQEAARDFLLKTQFHYMDIQNLKIKFVNIYSLYKELSDEPKEFDKELEESYKIFRQEVPSQMYVLTDNGFEEIIKGQVEERIDSIKNSEYYSQVEGQIKSMLNGEDR